MLPFKLANANASVIAVGATAKLLTAFIDTAGSASNVFPPTLDSVDIVAEDGDIRILYDGNTPTASKGILVKQGSSIILRKIPLNQLMLIATTGTVACSVQIGQAQPEDTTDLSGAGGGAVSITSVVPGTGATNLGKAEDAVHASADVGVMSLAVANEAQSNLSSTDGDYTPIGVNRKGTVYTAETLAPVYENNTTGKAVVEENYTNATVTADGQVKSSAGFIRSITFSATGTVTAGLITVYDNTAESGTVIWSGIVQHTSAPVTIFLGVPTATGIYVGYDGTIANVRTQVSYR